MKTIYRTLMSLLLFSLLPAFNAWGGNEEDLLGSGEVRDEISLRNKDKLRPIYFEDDSRRDLEETGYEPSDLPAGGRLEFIYLRNRRTLTGENCCINKLPNTVTVAGWTHDLGNILNDDLDDYCEFANVANVEVTVNPQFSIRDRSCYYAKGTVAGFCLVAGSGNTVLSLDVVKAMAVGFYRDGKLVGTVGVNEGQDAGGVNLSLIQIPGSDQSCMYVTAEAPGVFDEIMLDCAGGINLGVGQVLRVKYGFVGKSRMFTITKNKENGSISENQKSTPFQESDDVNKNVDLDYVKAWNPVLLGLPFPVVSPELEKFTNADLDDYITLTPILSIGYQGGAKFMMKDTEESNREIYPAGTEVGFCYKFGKALSLDLGQFINIVLFDRNGKKVSDETVSAGVLSLSVAGGGDGNISLVSKVPFSGAEIRFLTTVSVDLGAILVKYAYIRKAPEIRHHCPINPSMDASICIGSPEYQLRSNPGVSVTWTLEEQPEGGECRVTPDGYVTGLKPVYETGDDGEILVHNTYIFRATAADGCYDLVTLKADGFDEVECEHPLVNADGIMSDSDEAEYDYDCHIEGVTGGLLIINDLKDKENVLKNDGSYARFVPGLEIADNVPIVGVHKKNGLIYDASLAPSNEGMRLGFVVESAVEGLNLSLLTFYQVAAYYKGKEVYRHVIDESNTISADIGGANKSQKIRFSTVVPPSINVDGDGYTKVDQIILWSSGVLKIGGGELRIYNAFWEEPESECSGVMGCGSTMLSAEETHTTIDFSRFECGSAVSVASGINDLDNIIDSDKDSYATIFKTVDLSGVTIPINLGRTLDYRHQLGVIMDNNTYLANVEVVKVISVKTLYQGEETGDVFNDWNIVDANVIGAGDKRYVVITPKYMYDEVLLTFAIPVDALSEINVYGLFVRGDVDGDGIPDCKDSAPCSDVFKEISVNKVCAGDEIFISVKGTDGDYVWKTNDASEDAHNKMREMIKVANGEGTLSYIASEPGIYQLVVYDKDNKPAKSELYKVYPTRTTWQRNASNSDWNKWDNWSNGAPYCCTNVIIPSDASLYPDLDGDVERGDEYCCNYIHFEPQAEVNSVMNLNYVKAWVEMSLSPNRYHLLSAPLQAMYTGDMFIPKEMEGIHSGEYFTPLTSTTSPQNRFNPTIYQRRWYAAATERLWTPTEEPSYYKLLDYMWDNTEFTKWSREFNHLVTPYEAAQGFSLWVDNGSLPENRLYKFRFPKEHTGYDYFNDFTQQEVAGASETDINRSGAGRFIYESIEGTAGTGFEKNETYDRYPFNGKSEFTFELKAAEPTEYFLFGNPFMSRIDLHEFLKENSSSISEVIAYDGNANASALLDNNQLLLSTADIDAIVPMQAVFVKSANGASRSAEVKVTSKMLAHSAPGPEGNKTSNVDALRVILHGGGHETSMVVLANEMDVTNYALFDNEVAPTLGIFALDKGNACNILSDSGRIPLTIIKTPGEECVMNFRSFGELDPDSYRIIDLEANEEYTLDHELTLPAEMGASSGRFILVNLNPSDRMNLNEASDIIVEAAGRQLRVRSLDQRLETVSVYDLGGSLKAERKCHGAWEVAFGIEPGICLISVTTADGGCHSVKILIK